jgi:branched-chain amino acid aminotransferase
MMAKSRALKAGFDEVLFVNEDDQLAEGPTTNLFVVDATGRLRTPPEKRVLQGVTRQSVIELAAADDIPVDESDIAPHELTTAREVFLTGTTAGVLPAQSVDGRPVGDVCPGPIATRLGGHLRLALKGEAPGFEHWLTYV